MSAKIIPLTPPRPLNQNAIAVLEHWLKLAKSDKSLSRISVIGSFCDNSSIVDVMEKDGIDWGVRTKRPALPERSAPP